MKEGLNKRYRYHLVAVIAISLLSIIPYSNTLKSPFVFDDHANIRENRYVRLTDGFGWKELSDVMSNSPSSNRPVSNISFAINYYFGKYDVKGYHVFNIIIHLVNGILVYFFAFVTIEQASSMRNDQALRFDAARIPLVALFAALLFAAHPIQTQAVTYIVQRMTSMAATFILSSLLLYIHGRRQQVSWRRYILLVGSFVSWIMALGSKEIAATLPFIIFLYEWFFFQDLQLSWLKRHLKYLLVATTILGILAIVYVGENPLDRILSSYRVRDFTMPERVFTQARVVVFYMSLLLLPLPYRLNLLHHVPMSQSLMVPITTLLSFFAIIGLVLLAILLAKKNRLVSFCILWFFSTLALESSLLALEMVFEHRLYLPLLGVVIMATCLIFHLLSKRPSRAVVISAILVLSLGAGTYARNSVWKDQISLWTDVLSKNPKSFRANTNLGKALAAKGFTDEAIRHYLAALKKNPIYVVAHYNLGLALAKKGRMDEAIDHYLAALQVKPGYAKAHTSLGAALDRKGRTGEAIKHYSKALETAPNDMKAHNNLAVALGKQGRTDEAIRHLSRALQINPNYADAHNNLGILLFRQGDVDRAISHFRNALRINPHYLQAQKNLEAVMAEQRKY